MTDPELRAHEAVAEDADALLARFLAWWCEKQGISPFAEGGAAQWVAQFHAEERGEQWEEEEEDAP